MNTDTLQFPYYVQVQVASDQTISCGEGNTLAESSPVHRIRKTSVYHRLSHLDATNC